MKTLKIDKDVKVSADNSKVEENVRKSVEEWKKAKAEKESEEGYQKIITGKMRERIQLQHKYRGNYFERRLFEERLKDMKRILAEGDLRKEQRREVNRVSNLSKSEMEKEIIVYVDWMGGRYSLEHFRAAFYSELHNLATAFENENHFRLQLSNVGFMEDDLLNVINTGTYIKDHERLKKMEEEHEKKQENKEPSEPTENV